MADAPDLKLIDRGPVQAAEKADVLNLHRGQETITSPTIGSGNSLPDQTLANLVVTAEIGMHAEATAIPKSRLCFHNPHHANHICFSAIVMLWL